ncbi:N-acetylglucosamine-6-phosphate deacetylase [Sphingobacterium siyangense]|uniref:N-acetylglucosamine-6-phosphate deacetylase n=1 Tax=Sphingobacterium TaxID=28453 RepID=UPI003DA2B466
MLGTLIKNAKLILPCGSIISGGILVKDGKINAVFRDEKINTDGDYVIIDAQGLYLSAGFIDIHVHGGGGFDFMDCDPEEYRHIANVHARYGTTSMLPTSLTSNAEHLKLLLETYSTLMKKEDFRSRFLGLHLEGPYFALNQRGAQDPKYIRDPDPKEYMPILKKYAPLIARWSAAPELEGALDFGRELLKYGVIPSLAHTDAVYADIVSGLDAGYKLATHLYSGMSGMFRKNAFRYAGAIESCLLLDEITAEIIADGIHLPEPFLKLIVKVKTVNRIVLVTDAMRAAGTNDTRSKLGDRKEGLDVIIEQDVAKLPDRSSFAGSVATADRLIRTMVNVAGVTLPEAVKMLTINPAKVIGVEGSLGSIEVGKIANIILFDQDITIKLTMVDGNIIYSSGI